MSDYEQKMPGHPKFVAPATPTKRSHASRATTSSTNDSQRDTMPAERIKELNTKNRCNLTRTLRYRRKVVRQADGKWCVKRFTSCCLLGRLRENNVVSACPQKPGRHRRREYLPRHHPSCTAPFGMTLVGYTACVSIGGLAVGCWCFCNCN
jgi:hypothetical protein